MLRSIVIKGSWIVAQKERIKICKAFRDSKDQVNQSLSWRIMMFHLVKVI